MKCNYFCSNIIAKFILITLYKRDNNNLMLFIELEVLVYLFLYWEISIIIINSKPLILVSINQLIC